MGKSLMPHAPGIGEMTVFPVWDCRTEQWLIIKSVVYERDTAKVYATDGSCREVPVGMEDTWLWRTEGQ